jgi:hypothetical protein
MNKPLYILEFHLLSALIIIAQQDLAFTYEIKCLCIRKLNTEVIV